MLHRERKGLMMMMMMMIFQDSKLNNVSITPVSQLCIATVLIMFSDVEDKFASQSHHVHAKFHANPFNAFKIY
jgi:hypothetical protein